MIDRNVVLRRARAENGRSARSVDRNQRTRRAFELEHSRPASSRVAQVHFATDRPAEQPQQQIEEMDADVRDDARRIVPPIPSTTRRTSARAL